MSKTQTFCCFDKQLDSKIVFWSTELCEPAHKMKNETKNGNKCAKEKTLELLGKMGQLGREETQHSSSTTQRRLQGERDQDTRPDETVKCTGRH